MSISQWSGRVAVVTGASSGIGAAVAVELCRNGLTVVGLARRVEKVEALRSQLEPEQQKNFHAIKCDVSEEAEVVSAFAKIEENFGGVDVLINNAGVFPTMGLTDPNNSAEIQRIINTNLIGVINCTRETVNSIRKRESNGHVIHMNSLMGHSMPFSPFHPISLGPYATTKHAITALAEQHRQEFIKEKLNVKVTSLTPGFILTEMTEQSKDFSPYLEPKDIADAVIYLLSTPPNVLITEITVRAMNETV